jgi:hypothetical protein
MAAAAAATLRGGGGGNDFTTAAALASASAAAAAAADARPLSGAAPRLSSWNKLVGAGDAAAAAAAVGGNEYVDVTLQFDHVVWLGDLNYRLSYGSLAVRYRTFFHVLFITMCSV